jgi:hypothetical protein
VPWSFGESPCTNVECDASVMNRRAGREGLIAGESIQQLFDGTGVGGWACGD